MNFCIFIVKILDEPIQSVFADQTPVVEITVQFASPKLTGFDEFRISIWGEFGIEVMNYYQINDYIIVEGVLSLRDASTRTVKRNEVELTVYQIYPYLLEGEEFGF